MMQLHRLEGFYWVAKTGGYARAARAFPYPITQPAVHQQVKKLEGELAAQLFERVAKDRMRLTPAGRQLHGLRRAVLRGAACRRPRHPGHGLRGRDPHPRGEPAPARSGPRVGAKRLRKRCPGAEIHLGELSVARTSTVLLSGEADLLVNHLPEVPDYVATKQIATLHGFLVVPRDHRLAKRRQASLTEVRGDTFISYTPGLLAHHLQVRALAEHGVTPERTITAGTAAAILGLVEAGLGVSARRDARPGGAAASRRRRRSRSFGRAFDLPVDRGLAEERAAPSGARGRAGDGAPALNSGLRRRVAGLLRTSGAASPSHGGTTTRSPPHEPPSPPPAARRPRVPRSAARPRGPTSCPHPSRSPSPRRPSPIDLVICLDTSGSMQGLINAARQKLWSVVSELATAKPMPDLRVALLTYGSPGNDEAGHVVLQSDLTRDLDLISEKLFALHDAAAARSTWDASSGTRSST